MKKSFSLIEVVVVTSILSIFFVVAVSVLVVVLRNMKTNEHKIYATHYVGQLEDWLRTQKELNWVDFSTRSGTFCFNDETQMAWPGSPGDCVGAPASLNPPIYNRRVELPGCAGSCVQVGATITVSWKELGKDYMVQTKPVFSLLE